MYLLLRMMQAAALIVYLVGSLLLTGGQIAAGRAPMWGVAIDYPCSLFQGCYLSSCPSSVSSWPPLFSLRRV